MQRIGFLLICFVILSGCSDTGQTFHLARKGPAADGWDGTQWRFERIDGEIPLSKDAQIIFDDGILTVQAGCNRLQGVWRIDARRLVAGPFDQIETACPQASWRQGNAVSALLAATPHITAENDRLTLRSRGHIAYLVRFTQ